MARPSGARQPLDHHLAITLLQSRAAVRSLIGRSVAALDDLERGIELARAYDDRRAEAQCLQAVSAVLYSVSRFRETAASAQKALDICAECGDHGGAAAAHDNLCMASIWLGDFKKATEHCRQAMRIYQETGDEQNLAASISNYGLIEAHQGNLRGQLECFLRAKEIIQHGRDKVKTGLILNNLGLAQAALGDFKSGLECHLRALSLQGEIGDIANFALSTYNIGYLLFRQGSYEEAAIRFEKALGLYQKLGNAVDATWALTGIARAHLGMGLQLRARQELERVAKMARAAGDDNILSRIEMTMAELELSEGNPGAAGPYIKAVSEAAERLQSERGRAAALALRARSEEDDQPAAAEGDYLEAVEKLRKMENTYDLAIVCLHFGQFLSRQGREGTARTYLNSAEGIFRRIGNDKYLHEIGECLRENRAPQK